MRVGVVREELANSLSTQLQRQSPLADRRVQESYDNRVGPESIEGNHIQNPWVERLPIYDSFGELDGMKDMIEGDDAWIKFIAFLNQLKKERVGYPNPIIFNPYKHQATSVKEWWLGKDVVVSTGTGSGKTECFLWPLLGHLWRARYRGSGKKRGVKALVLYPMNALATDQMKRIRLMFGNPVLAEMLAKGGDLDSIERFFQFMLYTGRTYSHGPHHTKSEKNNPILSKKNLKGGENDRYMEILELLQDNKKTGLEASNSLFKRLYDEGFLPRIGGPIEDGKYRDYGGRREGDGRLTTQEHDTELLFRHEAHNVGYQLEIDGDIKNVVGNHYGGTPDLLFTNYSMLDYMLNRPIEDAIWEDTKEWLDEDEENKLLIVLDEAHLYQGMSGLHIGHLIRRLYLRLGLNSDGSKKGDPEKKQKIQFILTSASLGKDKESKKRFHSGLTSRDESDVVFVGGEHWTPQPTENNFDKLIENDLFGILEKLTDYEDKSESEVAKFFKDTLESSGIKSDDWFSEIRDSNFFAKFYKLTEKPRELEVLEKELWNKTSEKLSSTQSLLDLFTSMEGPHPGTGQDAPLVSVRAHILTRGLPRLHTSISNEKWSLLDGPQPILGSGNILDVPRPHLLLGCRSCGCPYIRVWIRDICEFLDDDGEEVPLSSEDILQAYIYDVYDGRKPTRMQIRTASNDSIDNSVGLDLYPLEKIGDDLFIIGAADDSSMDRRVSKPHGWLNRFDGRLYPDWRERKKTDDWIPVLFPIKSNSEEELVDLNRESSDDDEEMAEGAIFTFNFDSQCVRCERTYSRSMRMDQIIDFESRGDSYFATLTKKLFEIQAPSEGSLTPNRGRKILSFSDSVQRAAKLAIEQQRLSNIDEFRHLLLHLLHHPWYQKLPNSSKAISRLYPYFVLHSAALEKEPIEHKPTHGFDSGGLHSFSVHRSKVISAYLSEIDKIDSAAVENSTRNVSHTVKPSPDVERFLLDRIFKDVVVSRIENNIEEYSSEKSREEKMSFLTRRSKQPALTKFYVFEKREIEKHTKKQIKKITDGKNPALSPSELYWRVLRLHVTESEDPDPLISEIKSEVDFKKNGAGLNDIASLFFSYLKGINELTSGWDKEVDKNRKFQTISSKLESYTTVELGEVASFIVNYLITTIPNNFRKIEAKTRPRLVPEKIRPPPSFVGNIARILGQTYNSIDQIGLAYSGLAKYPKSVIRNQIDFALNEQEPLDFVDGLNEFFDITDDSDSKEGLFGIIDQFISALVRNGTTVDASRGASKFSLYDREAGFTFRSFKEGNFRVFDVGVDKDTIISMLKEIGCNSEQANFIYEQREILFNNSLRIGETAERYNISPDLISIYPLKQDDPLFCCRICSRPHPHPLDSKKKVCRWCRDTDGSRIELVEYNPNKNSVHRQRIEEPWRNPFFSLKPGKEEINSEGITILRAEEHTSQVGDLVKEERLLSRAIEFEMLFQDIPFVMPYRFGTSPPEPVIDILSCTTTMEVGIDIGSLVAVALRTIPRDAAQYQQRVGRAGRKRSQVCVALSWFDNSQYSQSFYHGPAALLNHPQEAPKVYGFNRHVTKQHIGLAILGKFTKRREYNPITRIRKDTEPTTSLMESHGKLEEFFGKSRDNFDEFKKWLENDWVALEEDLLTLVYPRRDDAKKLIGEARDELVSELERIQSSLEVS